MTIRRIKSGGAYEDRVGYCRAVVSGDIVYVAGTCAQGDNIPDDIVGQCASALKAIEKALTKAGSSMAHILRVNYYVTRMEDFEKCFDLLRAALGENPPAATVIEAKLITPLDLIEIEVTACLTDS